MRTFGKLRELIKQRYRTLADFAAAMGMDVSTLSGKLNGRTGWKQSEIEQACHLLGIPIEKVGEYFFY
jgi:transcriptional regulator with XRE-family HTH domain